MDDNISRDLLPSNNVINPTTMNRIHVEDKIYVLRRSISDMLV